ncbi:Omp28-related outer membrane protein [Moheibacter sediminis]|uniref:Outer membrane protein Omp28 n=1 Tax=Moheibacter sediminis TaxID=1434700 RepID=A0A1W2CGJ1_9FLAO|nr:Omp28-related outer membrane protein [Moheibacter sediminis]SMC84375.1 Outer membrane protein Omp28 [Moheibacter sediminis]
MKKLNNLTHTFIFLALFSGLLLSCGTEEDLADESIQMTMSAMSVPVGSQITFTASSSIAGDITSDAVYFVNGQQIEGSSFIPTEVNETNEVYASYNGKNSSTSTFASTDVIPSQYTQKVLLEDYTGTWCGWCPRMNSIMHYLTDYSDKIIPIAIHTQGTPQDPWVYEYALDMASTANYGAGAAPAGKINRIHTLDQFQQQHPCPNTREVYYPQVDTYLNQSAPLGLAINSSLSGSSLSINVKVGFSTDVVPEARLVVVLVEDGLIHNQYNYFSGSGSNCDPEYNYSSMPHPIQGFTHNHVLLKSFTDIYGDIIPTNQISNGAVYTKPFNVTLPANVTNASNLSVVAFVLGNGNQIKTRGVINVQSAKVGTNQDFD